MTSASTFRSSLKGRLYTILEAGKTEDRPSAIFDAFMVTLILLNAVAFSAETVEEIYAVYGSQLDVFNVISVVIFTWEYIARLWVCTDHAPLKRFGPIEARLRFSTRPAMIVDLLAILPFYLAFLIPMDLRVLRLFRLVRLLKLARFSPALVTLRNVFVEERRALFGALVVMLGLLLVSSTLMYFAERTTQPETFGSVPAAMWWALATLTTVGYGDVVPMTVLGKLLGGAVMILGLGMFALPIGIIATGFVNEAHRREFVVTWGLVARVPLFSKLDALEIAEITKILESRVVPAGEKIVRSGDQAERLYFIVSGEVEVDFRGRSIQLTDGDFFGEIALIKETTHVADIVACSRCNLLLVESDAFSGLMRRNPELREAVIAVADQRLEIANLSETGDPAIESKV